MKQPIQQLAHALVLSAGLYRELAVSAWTLVPSLRSGASKALREQSDAVALQPQLPIRS